MKSHRNPTRPRLARMALCIAFALGGPLVGLPGMAQVSISEVPLINADVSVKPNLMFILDNSGSMDFDYLPDALDDRQNQWDEVSRRERYGHWSSHCNGAAFNPDTTVSYDRPVTPDGRPYPNMSPTAAWSDGFIPATVSNSSYNVTTSINTETPPPLSSILVTFVVMSPIVAATPSLLTGTSVRSVATWKSLNPPASKIIRPQAIESKMRLRVFIALPS